MGLEIKPMVLYMSAVYTEEHSSPNMYPVVVLELELKLVFWLGGALPLSCIPNIKTFSDGKDALKYCCVLPCVWVNTVMRNY